MVSVGDQNTSHVDRQSQANHTGGNNKLSKLNMTWVPKASINYMAHVEAQPAASLHHEMAQVTDIPIVFFSARGVYLIDTT